MPLSTLVADAIERLQNYYNGGTYTPGTNPGGLGQGGHRLNFVPALQDLALVADAAATEVDSAVVSSAGSAAAADSAKNSAISAASTATGAASSASASASSAAATLDAFDDRYLGSKSADPYVDNDGNPLIEGALYWDSTTKAMKSWNGSVWATFSAQGPAGAAGISAQISDASANTLGLYSQLGVF